MNIQDVLVIFKIHPQTITHIIITIIIHRIMTDKHTFINNVNSATVYRTQSKIYYPVIVYCTMYKIYILTYTLYYVHCTLYILQCTIVQCTLYVVHCTLCNVYIGHYTVHCTLYSVHCKLYNV